MKSWNPVVNFVKQIKEEYIKRFGIIDYGQDEFLTTIEKWVDELLMAEKDSELYKTWYEMLAYLHLTQYGDLILFRYEHPGREDFWMLFDKFYRECRSVVINIRTEEIVLCPFAKFFNIGELEETSLDVVKRQVEVAKEIEISDKLDGSMQSARWYNGSIVMSGSQALDKERSWRLQDGYRMIQAVPNYEEMLKAYPGCTFIFEYISLRDAHVVKYSKEQEDLYLIGIRENNTGLELSYKDVTSIAVKYSIPTVEIFNKTIYQVLSELDDKTSDEAEGFVLRIDDCRYKLKYNDYVQVHKVLSELTAINAIIKNIADDTYDDLLAKLPTTSWERVNGVGNVIFNCKQKIENIIEEYYSNAPKSDKKEFMMWVNSNVPKVYQGFCREKFYGNEYNVLKSRTGYKKFDEIVFMVNGGSKL